ncbi:hypothetical protein [Legionella quateirensis]|nr:hypothetical protein [Legionella quateirensis]
MTIKLIKPIKPTVIPSGSEGSPEGGRKSCSVPVDGDPSRCSG